MSLRFRSSDGTEQIIAGLTPGGDIEAGAVAEIRGSFTVPSTAASTATSLDITFPDSFEMPSDDYIINFDTSSNDSFIYTVRSKSKTGFRVSCMNVWSSATNATTHYVCTKTYTVQHAAQNAEDITNIKAVIPSTASSTNQLAPKKYVDDADTALDGRVSNLEDLIPNNASVTNQLATKAEINNVYTKTEVDAKLDNKQNTLTFDNEPTVGSSNPVKSNGVKTALDAKQNTLTFDSTPIAGSSNPVTSDGIKNAIDDITSVIPSSASSSNKLITIANGIKNFHAGDLFLHTIVADNPTIVDTQTLVKYIYDNYFAPTTNAQTDRVTVWMVNNPTDSLGRYTECAHYLASRYYDITLMTWSYCRLVFEHYSFDSRLIVRMSPVGADMIPATCIWSASNDAWGTSTELNNETGWYTEGGQSKWRQVASVNSIAAAGTTISLHYTALHNKARRATMYGNNTIFNIDGYGANGSVVSYSGVKFNPTTDGKYGITLTWNDYINDPTVCVIKYYVNNVATALNNTSVSIQACVDTHWSAV